MLISGEVSVNKLVRVAAIATSENQNELAELLKILPQKAIETLVRDEKLYTGMIGNDDVQKPLFSVSQNESEENEANKNRSRQLSENEIFLRAHSKLSGIDLDVKLMRILNREIKLKLLIMAEKGLDLNSLLFEFFTKRELKIAQEKEQISWELSEKAVGRESV